MKFVFRQRVREPREILFAFFRNPRCLPLLHAEQKDLRVLRHGPDVRVGGETWTEITVFVALPVVLGFRHDCFEPPQRFAETLVHGPFTKFVHLHDFREADGGAEIIDIVEVELPWFYGGELGVRWLVAPGIHRSFELRRKQLQQLAETGALRKCARRNLQLLEAA